MKEFCRREFRRWECCWSTDSPLPVQPLLAECVSLRHGWHPVSANSVKGAADFSLPASRPPPIGNTISCAIERLSAEVCKLILAHCPPPSPLPPRCTSSPPNGKGSKDLLSLSPSLRWFVRSVLPPPSLFPIVPRRVGPPLPPFFPMARQRGGAFASRSTAPNLTAAQLSQGGRARLQPCSLQQQMRG